MSNDYFNHNTNRVPQGARAVADHINDVMDELSIGLDLLPSESELKQGKLNYSTDTGLADAYVITLTYVPTLSAGLAVSFQASNANTGASTLNANGTGAKAILSNAGSPLAANQISPGQIIELRYDGAAFRIMATDVPANGIKAIYESNADTNAFTDASLVKIDFLTVTGAIDLDANNTKLSTIEDSATADQTGAQIKVAYELEANTNAYTDSEVTKVGHISVSQAVDLDAIETAVALNTAKTSNVTHTGDVTGSTALTIAAQAVSLDKVIHIAQNEMLGRITAATGVVEVLTATQATTVLNTFTTALKGLVPVGIADSAKYLDGQGNWTTPSVTGTTASTNALATTGADVGVAGSAPPSTNDILIATSTTTATWQTPNATFNASFGSTAGTICEGDDGRLSDPRAPTAHSHGDADINGLDVTAITTGTFAIGFIPTGATSSTVSLGNHNHAFSGLSDTTITAIASGEILKWNGSVFINNTLAEAGIQAAGSYAAASHGHTSGDISALDTSDVTTGTWADARIAQSNITQHQAALSITESQISDLGSYSLSTHDHTLNDLTNVVITSIASGEIIKWNGSNFVNNTLAEAGIQAAGSYITTSSVTYETLNSNSDIGTGASQVAQGSHTHTTSGIDDYEEGTWTPVLSNPDWVAITYSTQIGKYTKIGNRVFISCNLVVSGGAGSSSSATHIEGLPFTPSGQNEPLSIVTTLDHAAGVTSVHCRVESTNTKIVLSNQVGTPFSVISGSPASDIYIAGSYEV